MTSNLRPTLIAALHARGFVEQPAPDSPYVSFARARTFVAHRPEWDDDVIVALADGVEVWRIGTEADGAAFAAGGWIAAAEDADTLVLRELDALGV